MSEFKLTTVEEFEAATARLLETGAKVGADSRCVLRIRLHTVNSVSRAYVAESVQWVRAVLHLRHREVSADAMYMVS